MTICPITYELFTGPGRYSSGGLKRLSPSLKELHDLPFTAEEQVQEAVARAGRMSIQGVQPKISAVVNPRRGMFELVDSGGMYILKPRNTSYPQLPENEDLSMRLAACAGIETPLHGLVYSKDGSMTYFIRRYDRPAGKSRLPVEDFAQLSGRSRETKYESSMEKVAKLIDTYTTFPALEKARLFSRTLFNFLIGNEDMHLKNFSLITRKGRVELAPAYDFLNTSLVLRSPEEMALPLNGKRNRLGRSDFIDYFAGEKLELTEKTINRALDQFRKVLPEWEELISRSFLSGDMKLKYRSIIDERCTRIRIR